MTWCRRLMRRSSSSSVRSMSSLAPAKGLLNHSLKLSLLLKIFGSKKFSSDHSSVRLFWMGVPVNSNLKRDLNCEFSSSDSLDS